MTFKHCACAISILLVLFTLGGCGKKGQLGTPEGTTYPQTYPQS